jgi:hypothetical protein
MTWFMLVKSCPYSLGLLMAKNPTQIHPYPNLVTLISIPHRPKNITRKLKPTHPIILLTPNQPVIGWKPMETLWVQLIVSHQANCIHIHRYTVKIL